jgi:RimJ/RimL family protein N-acetyltransferase
MTGAVCTNALGQPVGAVVAGWSPRPRPAAAILEGRWCRLEPLRPNLHAEALFRANTVDGDGRMWTYLPYGPFPDLGTYRGWVEDVAGREDPMFFAIVTAAGASGVAAVQRIDPASGTIEVAHVAYSPGLQATAAATEAQFLLMRLVFERLGYRRYEWKCDALNAPSRRAATRLGFTYEGTFRQAVVVKGRNRDTAWYSVVDSEWPRLRDAFGVWLAPENLDANGRQRLSLSALTASPEKPLPACP